MPAGHPGFTEGVRAEQAQSPAACRRPPGRFRRGFQSGLDDVRELGASGGEAIGIWVIQGTP